MRKTVIEIVAGAAAACVLFLICVLVIGQFYHLCLVKKFAYATLMGMPLGSLIGINLVNRFLYASKDFTIVGTLAGLAFTMILLLLGIYIVALAPVAFFLFPILISMSFLLGHKLGPKVELRKQVPTHRAID